MTEESGEITPASSDGEYERRGAVPEVSQTEADYATYAEWSRTDPEERSIREARRQARAALPLLREVAPKLRCAAGATAGCGDCWPCRVRTTVGVLDAEVEVPILIDGPALFEAIRERTLRHNARNGQLDGPALLEAARRIALAGADGRRFAAGLRWVCDKAAKDIDLAPAEASHLSEIVVEMLARLDHPVCDMCGQVHLGCLAHQGQPPELIPCKITPRPGCDYCRVHCNQTPPDQHV